MNTPILFARVLRAFSPALVLSAVCTLVSTAGLRGASATQSHEVPFTAIHVLGDSLSDTGRTSAVLSQVFQTTFPPPPYAPGRFSNGALWIEHLSPRLGRPYESLNNFAWAGSTSGRTNVFGPPLPGMLDQLDELLASSPKKLDHKALYVVFGGSNDFLQILGGGDPFQLIGQGVTNIITAVRTLAATGARDIVVVNLPDIGLTPRAHAPGANPFVATFLSNLFNQLLSEALDGLDFPVVRVDAFTLLNRFVSVPEDYGFTNVTDPGIANPAAADTYLFWDDIHPTTRAHGHLSAAIFEALAEAGLLKQMLKH